MDTNIENMNIKDVMTSSCDLYRKGKFTDCCELLQRTVDECYLKNISAQDEVEFIVLRNNLLVCNCLRILPVLSTEYVNRMTEFVNISKLYLYEKHIPIELRVNFICNTLHWFWLKPDIVPDYCYDQIMTLIDECLHEVLYENGNSNINMSSHVGKEHNILKSLECLSNYFLSLEPILVVQCIEMSQTLLLVFLSHRRFTSLLVNFTMQMIVKIQTITCAFKHRKTNHITNCFKFGLSIINDFLHVDYIKTIIISAHVSLCVKQLTMSHHPQVLHTLSTIDQFIDPTDELFCLICYLKAFANFNLEEFEVTLYYLSQMAHCLMEPFIKSRYYLLLGRTYSKLGNNELAVSNFEKLNKTEFNKIMVYYMSQHYEQNDMQFTQMLVLEQAIEGFFDRNNERHNNFSISYTSKVLIILHPQPDMTRRQLLYMAAKKKYEHSNYKLAASAYLSLMKLNECEEYMSDLVMIPSTFMLKHETVVALIKAHEIEEAFKLCQILIEEFEPGCNMWKSDSFWAKELNDYNFNVVGAILLAETGFHKNTDIVLEALNKSFNCLYAQNTCDYQTETNYYNESIKTLRRVLMGKTLLLKATVLSRLNKEEDCEAAFKKALSYNSGDEEIVYLYSKWLEHKGKTTQSMNVRGQFDRKQTNTITCDNIVMTYVLESKHGLEDTIIGTSVIDDLFACTDDKVMEVDNEMDPADDDIFNDLFID